MPRPPPRRTWGPRPDAHGRDLHNSTAKLPKILLSVRGQVSRAAAFPAPPRRLGCAFPLLVGLRVAWLARSTLVLGLVGCSFARFLFLAAGDLVAPLVEWPVVPFAGLLRFWFWATIFPNGCRRRRAARNFVLEISCFETRVPVAADPGRAVLLASASQARRTVTSQESPPHADAGSETSLFQNFPQGFDLSRALFPVTPVEL